jgi:hypothetical protein
MNLEERTGALEQQTDEGDEVQADQGLGQPLVVLGQAPETRRPGKGALDDPSTIPMGRSE